MNSMYEIYLLDFALIVCSDRQCWVDAAAMEAGQAPQSFCPADEHYLATLLASAGREAETDCTVPPVLAPTAL